MQQQHPDGWHESFVRGLWSYDLLLGAPHFLLLITLPLFVAALLLPSQEALIAMASVHAAGFGVTRIEPEWAKIIGDFLKSDGRIEP